MENEFKRRPVKLDRAEIALIISALATKKCKWLIKREEKALECDPHEAVLCDELVEAYDELINRFEAIIEDND